MAYSISNACIQCGACEAECPVACISEGKDKYVINAEECIECGSCEGVCPVNALEHSQPIQDFNHTQPSHQSLLIEEKWLREH